MNSETERRDLSLLGPFEDRPRSRIQVAQVSPLHNPSRTESMAGQYYDQSEVPRHRRIVQSAPLSRYTTPPRLQVRPPAVLRKSGTASVHLHWHQREGSRNALRVWHPGDRG